MITMTGIGGVMAQMAGNPQGGQANGGSTANVATVSGQNPQSMSPDAAYFSTGQVSDSDQKMLVKTITDYRNSWSQDRLERIRQWMENIFYWKGIQVIQWDNATNCWYDALAWSRANNDDGEDTDLERWINPITLMFCNVFTGTMSRAVPKTIVKPRNADPSLKDSVTAKSAMEAIRIIERQNEIRKLVRNAFEMLFLFGSYFRYTRPVVDGNLFGYDDVAIFEDLEISMPARFKCPGCGTETPAEGGAQNMNCPGCGSFMGQESYFGAGEGNYTSLKMAGVTRKPRAGVKWSLHSPLEIDTDPKAKGDNPLTMTPILCKDCEIDLGEARRMFPALYAKIGAGAESSTTANSSTEKMARQEQVSALGGMTADSTMANPTYSEVWMTPSSYYYSGPQDFGQRMEKMFPEGLKISMIGSEVVDIRAAVLTKEWSHAALYANQGVYCAALANTAVSFNARFNRVMWILDDWAARASTGLNFFDAARVDTEKMSGKPVPAGTGIPVPMRVNGEARPIQELMAHFDLPLNPSLWGYPQILLTFLEIIIGIPRQIGGTGTQDDVETLGGQQMQLNRASTVLKPYFENVQDEHAKASQNAFYCLQNLMKSGAVTKIWDVIESRGGAFQNNEVNYDEMQGDVEFSVDEQQNLPVSPDDLRTAIELMFGELSKNNPAAMEWFDVPANQDLAISCMLPGTVQPNEAQTMKTLADIQMIVENGPQMAMTPDGKVRSELPVHPSITEDFELAKKIVSRYKNEHFEMRVENSVAWLALDQYWDELDDLHMKVAAKQAERNMQVQQAGKPPKPGPSPEEQTMQQEFAQLMQQAGPAIIRLAQIAQMDPSATKGTANAQVSAAREIVDTTVDAARLAVGGK